MSNANLFAITGEMALVIGGTWRKCLRRANGAGKQFLFGL